MKGRHFLRQAALKALVTILFDDSKQPIEALDFVLKETMPGLIDSHDFAKNIVLGVIANERELDDKIEEFAPKWKVDKLSSVERRILEIATFELLKEKTAVGIVINEAVEMAKEFGDDNASKFVNGVLSSIAKEIN